MGTGWRNRVGEHEGTVAASAALNPLPFSNIFSFQTLVVPNNVVNMVSSINLPSPIPSFLHEWVIYSQL